MNDLIPNTAPQNAWASAESFALAQRMATALSSAAIFPTKFKDAGSCVVIINMAWRLNMDPLEVAQNMDIIHGNPCWKSAYVIAKITTSPQWEEFDFEHTIEGKVKNPTTGEMMDNKVCRVVAKRAKDGKPKYGNPVSFKMAILEGWWGRKDSKWPNMPDQMLDYRAASFFNRLNPTAELLGLRAADEAQDIGTDDEIQPAQVIDTTPRKAQPIKTPTPKPVIEEVQAESVDDVAQFEAMKARDLEEADGDPKWAPRILEAKTIADLEAAREDCNF